MVAAAESMLERSPYPEGFDRPSGPEILASDLPVIV